MNNYLQLLPLELREYVGKLYAGGIGINGVSMCVCDVCWPLLCLKNNDDFAVRLALIVSLGTRPTMQQPQKRSREPESRKPIKWSQLDKDQLQPTEFSAPKGNFNNVYGRRLYGDNKEALVLLGPCCEVAYEPSAWDEAKQAKWGKDKDKKLDANRKSDKWSLDLFVPEEFAALYRSDVEDTLLDDVFAQRQKIYPDKQLRSAEALGGMLASNVSFDKNTGRPMLKLALDGERNGSAPFALRDAETKEPLPADVVLTQGSEVYPLIDLSGVLCGKQSVKQYAKPVVLYVKKLAASRKVDADAYKVEFDE